LDAKPKAWHKPEKLEYDYSRLRNLAKTAWDKGEALAEEGDLAGAVAWLGRAHRSAPSDQNILFKLALLHLRAGDADGAASLFGGLAARHGTRECLSGLIAALFALGRLDEALTATRTALSETACDASMAALAERIAAATGAAGWCGLAEDDVLMTNVPRAGLTVLQDGLPVRLRNLSPGRFRLLAPLDFTRSLEVRANGQQLLGSPIAIGRVFRLEGFAERTAEGVGGWAWHPGAPGLDPVLTVLDEEGVQLDRLTASKLLPVVDLQIPLARPRSFAWACPQDRTIRIAGPDGRNLPGSPVAPEDIAPPRAAKRRPKAAGADVAADVVIPVYRGLATTLACIRSVVETVPGASRIWVVNDASPEPALVEALEDLARSGAIRLISTGSATTNKGFPAAVNAGLSAAKGRHVVLLNSDTLVAPGWLDRLREAACSAPDIGTATPISNHASILSYPGEAGKNPAPDLAGTSRLARLAARANQGRLVEIPTAHGFCMFIRRDCLEQTGPFEDRLFAQGYGEENDFCERARALGWRHVAVPEVYVAHLGGASFGAAREDLLRRNLRLLEQRHPGYLARVHEWIEADPLRPARRRLDAARWRDEASARPAYLLVTHGSGGGTARVVNERVSALKDSGYRPVVLRAVDGLCAVDDGGGTFPNLRYALPAELAALRRLLADGRPEAADVHHLLGHDHSILRLFAELGIPYDIWIHDYAWFCARLSFITGDGFFCGEAETSVCETCVAKWGSELEETIAPADLRRRSAAELLGARAVIVPSADVARRVSRHVPGCNPVIRPWEAEPTPAPYRAPPPRVRRRVAVVGAIGVDKGYDVLLACAQDAASRKLDLEFVVVGFTVNDEALLETNRVFITGMFALGEAAPLIRAQAADLAFLPSIWPETWCYALSDAWAGGLPAAVFDIGTPPARVRAARRGWVLPLGLPAPRVNDALLSLAMLNIHQPLSRAV
jgi:GT2 family glycosyltransferase/glycosyltransferase involved in cell wall biosynthesis